MERNRCGDWLQTCNLKHRLESQYGIVKDRVLDEDFLENCNPKIYQANREPEMNFRRPIPTFHGGKFAPSGMFVSTSAIALP